MRDSGGEHLGRSAKIPRLTKPPTHRKLVLFTVHVNFMRVVNFSEARKGLKAVIDGVIDDADYTIISRRDAPDAVLMSLDTFNSIMETAHLLGSSANAAHLAESIAQHQRGQIIQKPLTDD
jgi:antitoxin YefM